MSERACGNGEVLVLPEWDAIKASTPDFGPEHRALMNAAYEAVRQAANRLGIPDKWRPLGYDVGAHWAYLSDTVLTLQVNCQRDGWYWQISMASLGFGHGGPFATPEDALKAARGSYHGHPWRPRCEVQP